MSKMFQVYNMSGTQYKYMIKWKHVIIVNELYIAESGTVNARLQ